MATPRLLIDIFDSETQEIVENTELEIYGKQGGLATDPEISGEYLARFRGPYISALMSDVLTNNRWRLGKTMTEVAISLGTDHPTISRAVRWGILPHELETYLLACPTKPDDWEEPIRRVLSARHRAAFVGVAEYLGQKYPQNGWPLNNLREIHPEFLFTMWENRVFWKFARNNRDLESVHRLAVSVLDDSTREIIPFWYDKARRQWTMKLIERLRSDSRFAFQWLCLLQNRWERLFVTAEFAIEGLGWLERVRKLSV